MQRVLMLLVTVLATSFASHVQAASLRIEQTDAGASQTYAIFLDGLTEADQVTAISVSLLPGDAEFENYDADSFDGSQARRPGEAASFVNASFRVRNPLFPPMWGIIDGSTAVAPPSGPSGIGYAVSNPGVFLTPSGVLPYNPDSVFFSNVMLPKRAVGKALMWLFGGDGNTIPGGRLEATLAVPEPTTASIFASLFTITLGATRRGLWLRC